jgi:hypothetical protein
MFDGAEIVLAMGIVVGREILEVTDCHNEGRDLGDGQGLHPARRHYKATGFGMRQGASKVVVEHPDRCAACVLIRAQHGFVIFGWINATCVTLRLNLG